MNIQRQQPQSIEAEESLISSALLMPSFVAEICESLNPDDFYKPSHQKIFAGIKALHAAKEPVDIITLMAELERQETLQDVGGISAVSAIQDYSPVAPSVTQYARIVKEKSLLRQMIQKASEVIQDCYNPTKQASEIIDAAHKEILSVKPGGGASDCFFMSDLLQKRCDYFESIEKRTIDPGIMSGFTRLDAMTCGFQKGELTIIAARPSMGKTSFARSIIRNISKRQPKTCTLIFSLEMSKEQITDSDISSESGVHMNLMRSGEIKNGWKDINDACGRMAAYKIAICDKSAPHISEIARISRQMKHKHNTGLIVVDYLQLVIGNHKDNRVLEVSDISRGLKNLARELNVPVVALSQLNRSLENRANKRPIMSDLRDSGAIEQDADVIMFIYRDEVYNKEENNPEKGTAEIDVAKNRNGPTGMAKLAFHARTASFFDLATGGYNG